MRMSMGENFELVVFAANGFFCAVLLIGGIVKFILVIVSGSTGKLMLRWRSITRMGFCLTSGASSWSTERVRDCFGVRRP